MWRWQVMHTTLENAASLWKRMILLRKDFYLNKNSLSFYCKLPKISPGAYIFQRPYFWRGLSTEGNLRLKVDWASLIVGRKFTVLLCFFYVVFQGNFQVHTSCRGGLYLEGRFNRGFFVLRLWGACTWGSFSEFYSIWQNYWDNNKQINKVKK